MAGITPLVAVRPAVAHFCANPVEMRVGKQGTVNIGIAAEAVAATGVDVTIPEGFVFERAVEYAPWTATHSDGTVRFRGGSIPPYTCAFFSVIGTAPRKGEYPFHLGILGEDGSKARYTREEPFGEFAAQMVYAGVPIPDPAAATDDGGLPNGFGWAVLGAVVAGGVAVAIAARISARR